MAVTQFESVYARRSFPCWDEPAIKATFDIKLRAEVEKTTLSNMPIIKEEKLTIDGKEYKDVTFDTTPIMSTYIVFFFKKNIYIYIYIYIFNKISFKIYL